MPVLLLLLKIIGISVIFLTNTLEFQVFNHGTDYDENKKFLNPLTMKLGKIPS